MQNSPEFLDTLSNLRPPIMFINYAKDLDSNKDMPIFVIKDEISYIKALSKAPKFYTVMKLQDVNGVAMISILVEAIDTQTVYEFLLNVHNQEYKSVLKDLYAQDFLIFYFWDEQNRAQRMIKIENQFKDRIKQMLSVLTEFIPWTDDDFLKAKDVYFKMYPDAIEAMKSVSDY